MQRGFILDKSTLRKLTFLLVFFLMKTKGQGIRSAQHQLLNFSISIQLLRYAVTREQGPMQNLTSFLKHSDIGVLFTLALLITPATQVTAGTYLDSGHGGSWSDPSRTTGQGAVREELKTEYVAGNCAHCHEQHASIGGVEPSPVNGTPSAHMLFDDLAGNALCNHCHDNSTANGADNIASQIAPNKTYSHDPASSIGTVLCDDCHDPHVSQTTPHSEAADGNAVKGPLLSVAGTSVSSWTPGSPGSGGENLGILSLNPLAEPINYEYELCFRCHANNQYPSNPNLDVGLQFNPNSYSVHPVATNSRQWNNAFLRGISSSLKTPWVDAGNLDHQMYCSDCHGSDTTGDPQGPHGSSIDNILQAAGPDSSLDNLCLKCHNDPATAGNSDWLDLPGYGNPSGGTPNGGHSLTAHQYDATNNPLGCLACHGGIGNTTLASSIHGANYLWPDAGGGTGKTSTAFLIPSGDSSFTITQLYYTGSNDTAGNRHCAASCHSGGVAYVY